MTIEEVNFNPQDEEELKAAVDAMRRNMPTMIEYGKMTAHLRWETYNAYLEAGFNPDQALELCKVP